MKKESGLSTTDNVKIVAAVLVIAASIGAYYYLADLIQIGRVAIVVAASAVAVGLALTTQTGQSAWSFMKEANVERQKVVWPGRQEALQVTLMVLVLVVILGLLMWLFDALSFYVIYDLILKVGNP
ncbi:MAG: preprotein translocase subunit SecE [Gammaproteobacteria bacterium]|nr:preprotein translocase subunit SecE [Gammaproteobacteria bacterium]MYD77104.1 preprotein translocase subunit SecE [Gammaproteobacteria bacterium]MYJ52280.1 preprotein translocase subunit SecE [Gammaproteobacteria bacterium]